MWHPTSTEDIPLHIAKLSSYSTKDGHERPGREAARSSSGPFRASLQKTAQRSLQGTRLCLFALQWSVPVTLLLKLEAQAGRLEQGQPFGRLRPRVLEGVLKRTDSLHQPPTRSLPPLASSSFYDAIVCSGNCMHSSHHCCVHLLLSVLKRPLYDMAHESCALAWAFTSSSMKEE